MKSRYFVLLACLAVLLMAGSAEALQVYNPYMGGYSTVNAWSYDAPNRMVPRYYGEVGRPEGYGLVRQRTPYPLRINKYCENNAFLGHTSAWRPGRFYSGVNGMQRTQPMYRPQSNRCAPTEPLRLNTYKWNY